MKLEHETEIKHLETLAQSLQKAKFDNMTLLESITLTRSLEFIINQVKLAKAPKPVGLVSTDTLNKKVLPLKTPGKKK